MRIAGTEVNLKHKALEIYISGCREPHCPGCHNPELWDFSSGVDWKKVWPELKKKIFELKKSGLVDNIWLLGGDPLHQTLDELIAFMGCLRESALTIVVWTREYKIPASVASLANYIKTGPFVENGEAHVDPHLGITLANREQRMARVRIQDGTVQNMPEVKLDYANEREQSLEMPLNFEEVEKPVLNMPTFRVKVKKLRPDAVIPEYHRIGDAGFDLHAAEDVLIWPQSVKIVPTGLAMEIPYGLEMQIRLRSGASLHKSIILANAPGTVDSGYRGEIGIIVRNVSSEYVAIKKGERIAQGVLSPVAHASFTEVEELSDSERGSGGFGSTGNN